MAQPNKRRKQQASQKANRQKKLFVGAGVIGVLILAIVLTRYWQSAETVTIAGAYTKGAENAPIVMREFSDYQ